MQCLKNLKETGFQTGAGMMIGSPLQTAENLAEDMLFLSKFQPHMVGMGPFIPSKGSVFENYSPGTFEETVFCLSLVRLMLPDALLPATTALGTIKENGREMGILAGANVVMPNLSPSSVRKKYELYNNKLSDGDESAQSKENLSKRIKNIGYEIVTDRGDVYNG
jgi:biotin synthase